MHVSSLPIRRSLTVAGALAALILGFSAIQAAAAWTASAAPLAVTPVSANSIEAKLFDEQSRSTDLQAQLTELSGNTQQMAAALEAAQARIDSDTKHAKDLEKDLRIAKKKLAALQRSLRQAAAAPAARAQTTRAAPAPATTTRRGGDDNGGGGDD
jgi:peptidoglycan hydrolase CwlO-like protein